MFSKIFLSLLLSASAVAQTNIISPDYISSYKQFRNYVINPGAEKNDTDGVVDTSSIASRNTSTPLNGSADYLIDASASAQKVKFKLKTLPTKFEGGNAECNFTYNGTMAGTSGDYKAYAENNTGTKLSADYNMLSTGGTKPTPVTITFPPGATLDNPYYLVIESTVASPDDIRLDDVYCGDVTSIGQFSAVSDWVDGGTVDITATGGGLVKGTVKAVDKHWYRMVGSNLEGRVEYRQTAATTAVAGTGDYLFALPSAAGCVIDTTKITPYAVVESSGVYDNNSAVGAGTVSVSSSSGNTVVSVYDTTKLRLFYADAATAGAVGQPNYTIANATTHYNFHYSVPCQGRSASQSAAAANQTDYGPTAYTPTFTGFGAVTVSNCTHERKATKLLVECAFTAGTTTATEARVSLPNSLVTRSTIPTLSIAGNHARNTNGAEAGVVLKEPNVSYMTFATAFVSGSGLVKQNANAIFATGNLISLKAEFPIAGWEENQRAPTLVGSVTSNSVSALRIEGLSVAQNCTASPCTIANTTSTWVSSIVRNSAGNYTINFVSGTFSAAPICQVTADKEVASPGPYPRIITSPTTSAFSIQTIASGAAADSGFQITCVGNR